MVASQLCWVDWEYCIHDRLQEHPAIIESVLIMNLPVSLQKPSYKLAEVATQLGAHSLMPGHGLARSQNSNWGWGEAKRHDKHHHVMALHL